MTLHVVTSAVVKVSIGSPGGNRVAHIARRGDVLPAGVDETQLETLAKRGLIEKVAEQETAPAAPATGSGTPSASERTDATPTDKWTKEQLATFAAERSIDISSASNKGEAVAILTAELATREQSSE